MEIFKFVFITIVFLFVLFLAFLKYDSEYKGKPKAFFKKILTLILFCLGMFLAAIIFIAIWAVFYKIFGNPIVASVLAIIVGLLLLKPLNK